MKAKKEENKKPKQSAGKKKNAPAVKNAPKEENVLGELNAPRWSVVSFESRLANNLTYAEAAGKLEEFKAQKVAGLCIVTDEAAARIVSISQ